MVLKKYITIRYNTAAGFKPSQWNGKGRVNLDPVWLVERLALFDNYCAPSLEAQSLKDFTVLIAFDADTHENYVCAVCNCIDGIEVKPILVEAGEDHGARFNASVQEDSDAEFVSLTRLDSDDALAPSFMERIDHFARREIERRAVDEQPLYIAFPNGQNFDTATGRYTNHEYAMSAFGTLVEKRSPAMKGVYSDHHQKMATRYNTIVAPSKDAQWCIVIHDNNAANILRGEPTEAPSFRVGRLGAEARRPALARREGPPPAGRSAKASRTVGNLIRFLSGRPISLRK
ncbi:glycosyltransferase [Mesorhizobium sp. VK25A]|uniref:Glycosyltransferase n=1 Tax=Mesorhizobium vachelliae TaxID=3072309 RepID=A0ABU5A436_9HYPH|nr:MULTISPECIES: glycosyltransferase [unclassified Mesorhizobium]MDX8531967.1 glycosyltransferase [Mesorhizobium sp. VK25D]MDX8543590.1 glycosyltransferase [Mesorhizobium sp. VK25A]